MDAQVGRTVLRGTNRFCATEFTRFFLKQLTAARGLSTVVAFATLLCHTTLSFCASARSTNFVVTAATQSLASEIAQNAEQLRKDLAIEWLGQELPRWQAPCPIVAHVRPDLGAGGKTSFMFRQRVPFGWEMEIQGSRERILDSVLPHEVTHTVFATHFGRPLPRWADEGACTTVEHASERRKQELWLVEFLKTERGIPFNRMFAMTEYPGDILPLYSQGYSVARYLIAQGGKPKFVDFVGMGLDTGDWTAAIQQFYGYGSLGELQTVWVDWVIDGSRIADVRPPSGIQLAAAQQSSANSPAQRGAPVSPSSLHGRSRVAASPTTQPGGSWYARSSQAASAGHLPDSNATGRANLGPAVDGRVAARSSRASKSMVPDVFPPPNADPIAGRSTTRESTLRDTSDTYRSAPVARRDLPTDGWRSTTRL